MHGDESANASTSSNRVVVHYGERLLPFLPDQVEPLISSLITNGAMGLIVVDASPLSEIERFYGARALRRSLESLASRVRQRLVKEIGEGVSMTAGALDQDQILFFLHRPRTDRSFYARTIPRLAEELREYVNVCSKRIVYPYLTDACDLPVGHGIAFHRSFGRPETQIRRLIESTLDTARFEVERLHRERSELLRRIILEETLSTVYEPIVLLETRTVIGFEGLTRGPVGSGLERPPTLFSVARRSNLEYELDSLCRRLALRNAAGIDRGLKLFLNILPASIHDPDFSDERVAEALQDIGLAPKDLVLEISEQQAISNFPIFREAIDHFSQLGFGIALDDVGAGHSSLATALELSPDFLKIDMSLVRGIDDNPHKQELLRGLQGLAEKMRAVLIAEGIETEAELETIRGLGVELGQGYVLGRGGPLVRSDDSGSAG